MIKKSYFQGTEEPAPKKKKYKSEPAIVMQPRFKEPLYRNYDLYETEGVNGPAKHGLGVGWHDMHKYKSISEFLKDKRKKLKDKYKADDSWIEDDGRITKKDPNKIKVRAKFFSKLLKLAIKDENNIDFKADEYSDPTISNNISDNPVGKANYAGGYLDEYLPKDDFEGKSPDKLNFGRDYDQKEPNLEDIITKLIEKYHSAPESPLLGLPDGVDSEAKDAHNTINDINPEYGTTDLGNTTYKNLSY